MAKVYDPIMCMMVDEPTKAQDAEKLHYYQHSYTKKWYVVSPDGKVFKEFNTEAEAKNYVNGKAHDSALDEAIKTADVKVHDSVDIEHIADYLWTWVSGRDIAHELLDEGLDKYSGPHDPEHKKEAYEFARKYAASELNKVYSKLKSVVEKRLKEGFETNKRLIDSYK